MAISRVLFSHKSDEWETPQDLYDKLNTEFRFDVDVCANEQNTKCERFFTIEKDGLRQDWKTLTAWCNPPYSNIKDWAKKCSEHKGTAVMLVPARTDTKWFHEYCNNKDGVEIRFIKGRLKFGNSKNSAPFPSMLIIFRGKNGKDDSSH